MSAITITNVGHNLIRDGLKGANNPKITYVALGTSSTAPTVSDTKLGAEAFRKAVTSYTNGASVGEVLINLYLSSGDAVGLVIQEVGFYGGNSATSAANSGILLAHGQFTHTHLATETLQFQLDLIA